MRGVRRSKEKDEVCTFGKLGRTAIQGLLKEVSSSLQLLSSLERERGGGRQKELEKYTD